MKKITSIIMVMLMCFISTGSVFASTSPGIKLPYELKNSYEYKNLSYEQQEKLNSILKDKELWEKITQELMNDTQEPKVNIGNDVVIYTNVDNGDINKVNMENLKRNSTSERTVTSEYSKTASVLGVEMLTITGYVTYSYIPGKKIVEAKDSNVYVEKNLNPILTVDISSPTGLYKTKTTAYGKASVTFGAGWDSLDIDMKTGIFKVWGDYNGKHGGSLLKGQ